MLKLNFELKYLKGPSMNYLGLMLSDISTLVSIRKHLVSAGATKLGLLTTVRSTVMYKEKNVFTKKNSSKQRKFCSAGCIKIWHQKLASIFSLGEEIDAKF